jgi:transposase
LVVARRRHELSDAEWSVIEPLLPPAAETGRPREDDRKILNGIFWILGTGAPWRDLPERYGPWSTVYSRYWRWRKAGVFDALLEALQREMEDRDGMDWELFLYDGTHVRAHRAAAGASREKKAQG